MGTRSLTYVYDEQGEKIINLYRQFDGYPTGHGQELAEFLNKGRMVNGLELDKNELLLQPKIVTEVTSDRASSLKEKQKFYRL